MNSELCQDVLEIQEKLDLQTQITIKLHLFIKSPFCVGAKNAVALFQKLYILYKYTIIHLTNRVLHNNKHAVKSSHWFYALMVSQTFTELEPVTNALHRVLLELNLKPITTGDGTFQECVECQCGK